MLDLAVKESVQLCLVNWKKWQNYVVARNLRSSLHLKQKLFTLVMVMKILDAVLTLSAQEEKWRV